MAKKKIKLASESTADERGITLSLPDTTAPASMRDIAEKAGTVHRSFAALEILAKASAETGNIVQLLPECHFLPVLIGEDGGMVLLYQFIEAIDGLIDYEAIKEEFPSLTDRQIYGGINFLRKVAQFNASSIDVDALEDDEILKDPSLIGELKVAIANQEISRVLNFNK